MGLWPVISEGDQVRILFGDGGGGGEDGFIRVADGDVERGGGERRQGDAFGSLSVADCVASGGVLGSAVEADAGIGPGLLILEEGVGLSKLTRDSSS